LPSAASSQQQQLLLPAAMKNGKIEGQHSSRVQPRGLHGALDAWQREQQQGGGKQQVLAGHLEVLVALLLLLLLVVVLLLVVLLLLLLHGHASVRGFQWLTWRVRRRRSLLLLLESGEHAMAAC
jgi:Flp pilus assembly protein TadB